VAGDRRRRDARGGQSFRAYARDMSAMVTTTDRKLTADLGAV
jgi:hypothetical protein